jgi:hypothetical protein
MILFLMMLVLTAVSCCCVSMSTSFCGVAQRIGFSFYQMICKDTYPAYYEAIKTSLTFSFPKSFDTSSCGTSEKETLDVLVICFPYI